MNKRQLVLGCILVLVSLYTGCTTSKGASESSVPNQRLALLDVSAYDSNVYVGLSGPYLSQERMVEMAILNCAKNILLKEAIALDSKLVMQWSTQAGLLSFAKDAKAYYDNTRLSQVIDSLEIITIEFDEQAGAVVIARNTAEKAKRRPYQSTYASDGKPTWISTYPQVKGYQFGVGSSKAYYFLNDSLEASDFEAAQNILDLKTEHSFLKSLTTTQSGSTDSMENALYQAQRGLLEDFSILARYYDQETDTYWSLACSKE